jgi:hypothetical protein
MYKMQSPASSPDFMDPRYSQLRMSASSSKLFFPSPDGISPFFSRTPKEPKSSPYLTFRDKNFHEQKDKRPQYKNGPLKTMPDDQVVKLKVDKIAIATSAQFI